MPTLTVAAVAALDSLASSDFAEAFAEPLLCGSTSTGGCCLARGLNSGLTALTVVASRLASSAVILPDAIIPL